MQSRNLRHIYCIIAQQQLVVIGGSVCEIQSIKFPGQAIEIQKYGKKPFKCDICDQSFSAKAVLNRHIDSIHKGIKPFKCNVCDKAFAHKLHLNGHIESVHKGKKPFKCNICDASFSGKGYLNGHIESVHKGKKTFLCDPLQNVWPVWVCMMQNVCSYPFFEKSFCHKCHT